MSATCASHQPLPAIFQLLKRKNSMSLLNRILSKIFRKETITQNFGVESIPTIEEFPKLSDSDRIRVIIFIGDSGKVEYFPLMKYAILSDKEEGVKFAALKRIRNFKNHNETIALFTELKNNKWGVNLEPYFSMALSGLGIITIEEFEERIHD